MKNINDIRYELEQCNNNYHSLCGSKIEKHLSQIIAENEKIKTFISGDYDKKRYVLFITDKRVVMLSKEIFCISQVEIPLEKISSIGNRKGVFYGKILIWNNSGEIIIENVEKRYIDNFIDVLNKELNNYKTLKIENKITTEENVVTQLERLSALYKDKVLTEYEFNVKKQELLDKLK